MIRDPIHGDLKLSSLESSLIDLPSFQRLRFIRQLGATYLVYPGANHNRFEHSLGSMHLAGRIMNELRIRGYFSLFEEELLRIASLLHDIGHGPLSHVSERATNMRHEEISASLIESTEISDILIENGISPRKISDLIRGISEHSILVSLITGELDVDRMDYLVRDAYYSGVAYGIIDLDRIIQTIDVVEIGNEQHLIINEGGIQAAEAMLVARDLMYPTVYNHHTKRIAEEMLIRAIKRCLESEKISSLDFMRMDDYEFFNLLNNTDGYPKDIFLRFKNRNLFKRVITKRWTDLEESSREWLINEVGNDERKHLQLEEEIAGKCGLENGLVLIDVPLPPPIEEMKISIKYRKNDDWIITDLADISPLAKSLQKTYISRWMMGVYTPKEHVERVRSKIKKILF
ncbi:MAG: HD domain-containing protein [Candidatus Hydrothermarchaeota archaeon]